MSSISAASTPAGGGSFHVQAKQVAAIKRLDRFHVSEALSTEHVHTSKGDAIAEIVPTLDQDICAACTARIFRECPPPPEDFLTDQEKAETPSPAKKPLPAKTAASAKAV